MNIRKRTETEWQEQIDSLLKDDDENWLFCVLNTKNHTTTDRLQRALRHTLNLIDCTAYGRHRRGHPRDRLSRVALIESDPENPHCHLLLRTGGKITSQTELAGILHRTWQNDLISGRHGRIEPYDKTKGGTRYIANKLARQSLSAQPNPYWDIQGVKQ